MKTIIIDDIAKNREVLVHLLGDYCPQVEIVAVADSVGDGVKEITGREFDLLLLDVEMPDGTGFDLLDQLDHVDFEVIFVTAHDQYALKAIKFCALDYILKPVDVKELIQAIHRATDKIKERRSKEHLEHLLVNMRTPETAHHKIALPTLEGLVFITVDKIIRCEADGSYTKVVLNGQPPIVATRKIKGFEDLLGEYGFFRVHRSHLVNLRYIEKYYRGEGGYVSLSDGTSVDVSRRKKEQFLEKLRSL